MKAIPGKVFRGNRQVGPGLLEGHVGALDSSALRSPLEKCLPAESLWCQPVGLGSSPFHLLTVAICHGTGCMQETPAVNAETWEGAAARHEGASLLQ